MVQVAITARNPLDSAIRIWGVGIDKVPTGNWTKDESVVKATKRSGELWNSNLQLADGKHKLYFIISQTVLSNGTYQGEALFDTAGFNFQGVDNDSLAIFDVTVKGGKASRTSGTSATTKPTDVQTEPTKTGFTSKASAQLAGIKNKLYSVKLWNRMDWVKAIVVTVAIVGAGFGIYWIVKRMKNGKRRRF